MGSAQARAGLALAWVLSSAPWPSRGGVREGAGGEARLWGCRRGPLCGSDCRRGRGRRVLATRGGGFLSRVAPGPSLLLSGTAPPSGWPPTPGRQIFPSGASSLWSGLEG